MGDSASERATVAVVDDDPRIRALLEDELTDEGFEPYLCASGAELLQLVDRQPIDLILLDLMMPEMDGLQCLQQLKTRRFPGSVVVVTALSDDAKRREAIESGAKDYVLKPDLFESLPGLINQYLRVKQDGV
ncbi:MAG: response regulator [Gammaproteobacteria bacterium]|jgi:DNA-binding response OmpR family regulator|nr:response regulator [Gammaproteobacteria bacterium]